MAQSGKGFPFWGPANPPISSSSSRATLRMQRRKSFDLISGHWLQRTATIAAATTTTTIATTTKADYNNKCKANNEPRPASPRPGMTSSFKGWPSAPTPRTLTYSIPLLYHSTSALLLTLFLSLSLTFCLAFSSSSKPTKYFTTAIFGHKVITKYTHKHKHTHTRSTHWKLHLNAVA